jgi:hypothetical protein
MPIMNLQFNVWVEGNNLVYKPPYHLSPLVVVDSAPSDPLATNGPIVIGAINSHYLLAGVLQPGGGPSGQFVWRVHDRVRNSWRSLQIEGDQSRLRLFGDWLATDVEMQSSGSFSGNHPEKSRERDARTDRLPSVYGEYGAYCSLNHRRFPGVLVLQNLQDNRRIRLETHQEDSEILFVSGDSVLYRINDAIFQAKIVGDALRDTSLLARDEDVPEVHWVFWSK